MQADHRALPRPRGPRRGRPGLDPAGHRRAQLVHVLRVRARPRDRRRSGSTTATPTASPAGRRRSSPTRSWPPRWPTSSVSSGAPPASRDFRFAVIDEAFGRGSDVSTRYALDAVRPARAAAADRHPAAEGARHRALRARRSASSTTRRQLLAAADADDRGVSARGRRGRRRVGRAWLTWSTPDDVAAQAAAAVGRRRRCCARCADGRALPARSRCRCAVPALRDRRRPRARSRRWAERPGAGAAPVRATRWSPRARRGAHGGPQRAPERGRSSPATSRRGRLLGVADRGADATRGWSPLVAVEPDRALLGRCAPATRRSPSSEAHWPALLAALPVAARGPRHRGATCARSAPRGSTPSSSSATAPLLAALLGVPGVGRRVRRGAWACGRKPERVRLRLDARALRAVVGRSPT